MPIQITNSLGRKKEVFTPLVPGKVKMYVCGPTVYGLTHIGNARPVVFFDVVRRYLKFSGYEVTFVSNFTDVDDKIINRAREEKTTSTAISELYTQEFIRDVKSLGVTPPDVAPKVTEHIPQIISFIEKLVANGAAYVAADGEVFFSVRKFKDYGKLSGKNIDDLISGARVAPDEKKQDPLDFSLWKPQKAKDEPAWESPWGPGRPGWHIECSVMAYCHLGESFDIHGGGMDLTHPHHENEIAQSEACTHKPYVRYWMHNNMLTQGAEKMSKSLGNIYTTRDFVETFSAEVLKAMLLSGHYRSTIDYSDSHIREVQASLHRFYKTKRNVESLLSNGDAVVDAPSSTEENEVEKLGKDFQAKWREAMDDDFNTAKVFGIVFEYVRAMNACLGRKKFKKTKSTVAVCTKYLDNIQTLSGVLNIFAERSESFLAGLRASVLKDRKIDASKVEALIQDRKRAREAKDWALADKFRDELAALGIEIYDSPSGTTWDVAFSEA